MLFSRTRIGVFVTVLICLIFLPMLTYAAQDEIIALPNDLSPALCQIAEDFSLIKTATVGSSIGFNANDFEKLLGVTKISEIMITSLPDATHGTLKLGDSMVLRNQVITRSRIKDLKFIPSLNESFDTSFQFRVIGSEEYQLCCQLYLTNAINYRPSVESVSSNRLQINTFKNIATYRRMSAIDPENDSLSFEIVKYPKKGILGVMDRELGEYVYTPITDYVGNDSFTYEVYDKYGNRSDPIEVSINIEENNASVVYYDLIGERGQYPALRLTASGITQVRYENGYAVFAPEESVSRIEFLVCAMKAAGYQIHTSVTQTPFVDDEMIPASYKGYVSAAVSMGFIKGSQTEEGVFLFPSSPITRAECAVILDRILQPQSPQIQPVFSDSASIPTYAADAMNALYDIGILECIGTEISPSLTVNRAQSAEILCALMDHLLLTQ